MSSYKVTIVCVLLLSQRIRTTKSKTDDGANDVVLQMLAEDDNLQCGTVNNSATMNFLRKGTKPVFSKLWTKIRYSKGLVPNATAGRNRVIQSGR